MCRCALAASIALILAASLPASAATTYTVTSGADSGPGSLRAALGQVADGDGIVFASNVTTVTLDSGLDITHSINLNGSHGTAHTTIERSGTNDFRLFKIGPGTATDPLHVLMFDLTLKGGHVTGDGGAIDVADNVQLMAFYCAMDNNYASGFGGAIHLSGTSTLDLEHSTLANNSAAQWGGAISIPYGGDVTIASSTLSGNSARDGGAIQAQSWYQNANGDIGNLNLTITNSTITGNTGSYHYGSAIQLFRSYNGNSGGDGTAPSNVTMTLRHVTIAANNDDIPDAGTSFDGKQAAIYAGSLTNYGTTTLTISGSVLADGHVTVKDVGPGVTVNGTDNLFTDAAVSGGSGNVFNADPQLSALGDYGGPTQTMPPASGSPAVNAQPEIDCTLPSDQRGATRPMPVGGGCDMGAVELDVIELDTIFANGFDSR